MTKGSKIARLSIALTLATGLSACATGGPLRWPWEPPLAKVVEASLSTPDEREEKTVVTLMTDRPVEAMAYRLRKPDRVAVEIGGAALDEAMAKSLASSGLVRRVTVIPFEQAEAVRVEMETITYTDFDLAAEGTRVVLTLTPRIDREKEELRRQLEAAKVTIARMKDENTPPAAPVEEMSASIPTPVPSRTPEPPVLAPPIEKVLIDRVEAWRRAWEGRESEAYAELYAAGFASDGYDRNGWLERKKRIFSRAGELSVAIIDPKVLVEGEMARVVFVQEYRSGRSFDRGWKELTFVRDEGAWRIVAESWRRLR
ncbi:MAG: nuclear transport factor 2 family protein [Nitrospinae bacterium]|nr:nuclear transport factor 2 family protein [Nitrospinota bacterium]